MTTVHESRTRLLYRDVDQMGVLYYARYLELFEMGRTEFVRSEGFSYRDMEDHLGLMMPVTEARCRYHASLVFDEVALVRTWIAAWTRTTVRYAYEIRSEERDVLSATGECELACLRKADSRPAAFPEALLELFRRVAPDARGRSRRS